MNAGIQKDHPVKMTLVTPCLNPGPWLEECLLSVFSQEKGDYELEYFVIDGGSTDGSAALIARHQKNISWWCSEPDRGLSHAINKGLSKAKGEYFNWLNADDFLKPGTLAFLAQAIKKNPEPLFIGGYFSTVDAKGQAVDRGFLRSPQMDPGKINRKKALRNLKSQEQPGGLFLTSFLRDCGGADEKLLTTMDQDLLLKALLQGDTLLLDESLIYFRKHSRQISSRYSAQRAGERQLILENLIRMNSSDFLNFEDLFCMEEAALFYAWNCHRKGGRAGKALQSALQGLLRFHREPGSAKSWLSRIPRSFQIGLGKE